ncbi:hypothetical protein B0J12DRAFT_154018 [Macrophomina phaseolina]|uniref:Uncharacterized protein n=1 Tax=Macrophomina phaseolina TaxID=35725 RepID=A0ABQ8G5B5_9PEZI|nr:hypothetical protein B0J12DRAFT_154018 [Macrophomina phaseolina]
MHGLLSTALLCMSAALTSATTVADDGRTFSIWADFSRCDRADNLTLEIRPYSPSSAELVPANLQTTGEHLAFLTGPWNGSITLLEPDRMGPYRQQYLDLQLWAPDAPSRDGYFGNATFVPGAQVRPWRLVQWGGEEAKLDPQGGRQATGVLDGVAGTVLTKKSGALLWLEWCTDVDAPAQGA